MLEMRELPLHCSQVRPKLFHALLSIALAMQAQPSPATLLMVGLHF